MMNRTMRAVEAWSYSSGLMVARHHNIVSRPPQPSHHRATLGGVMMVKGAQTKQMEIKLKDEEAFVDLGARSA